LRLHTEFYDDVGGRSELARAVLYQWLLFMDTEVCNYFTAAAWATFMSNNTGGLLLISEYMVRESTIYVRPRLLNAFFPFSKHGK
jgi:hypothetical protein